MKIWKIAACAVGLFLVGGTLRVADANTAPGGKDQQEVTHNFDRTVPLPAGSVSSRGAQVW